jgi:hypothetical protein
MQTGGAFSSGRDSVDSNRKFDFLSLSDRTSHTMMQRNEVQVREEIVLEPELLNSLYRRGGRRLRDIQKSCKVNVWFDKFRGVLQISGTETCVAAAKNLIEGLGGPRAPVSAAVWAELSRTRKLLSGPEAAVARIQQESGCRIHVERTRQEVHLFGNSESVTIAQKLLDELEQSCSEEVVKLNGDMVNSTTLQAIANKCGVTMRLEDDLLHLLGLHEAVKKSLDTLNQVMKDADFRLELPVTPTENVDMKADVRCPSATHPMSSPKTGKADMKANPRPAAPCPTCKACPFCPSCGHPTTFVDNADASGFAPGVAGNMYSQGVPMMWRQMPVMQQYEAGKMPGAMPYEGGNGQPSMMQFPVGSSAQFPAGAMDGSMVPMAFMVPGSQNMQVCFVPAAMMAG